MSEPDENSEVTKQIKNFLCECASLKIQSITLESRLLHDFDIAGDDADELLADFSKQFNVDISHLPRGDYFPDERIPTLREFFSGIITGIKMLLGEPILESKDENFLPLTVADLVRGASTGVLEPKSKRSCITG